MTRLDLDALDGLLVGSRPAPTPLAAAAAAAPAVAEEVLRPTERFDDAIDDPDALTTLFGPEGAALDEALDAAPVVAAPAPAPAPVDAAPEPNALPADAPAPPPRARWTLPLAAVAAAVLLGAWALRPGPADDAAPLGADAPVTAAVPPEADRPPPRAASVGLPRPRAAAPNDAVDTPADPAPAPATDADTPADPGATAAVAPSAVGEPGRDLFTVPFPFDGWDVRPDAVAPLLARARSCDGTLVVTGHTCALGDPTTNHRVGLARAHGVRRALAALGVDPDRVDVRSAGAGDPVAPNHTASGRRANRRATVACLPN